jgi:putative spermidine/putrescine transport system ATP-binding protein/spermidine/putrescine transport system ATP-binding protein
VDAELPSPRSDFAAAPRTRPTPPRARSTTVRLNELSKHYGEHLAVDSLSLTIEPGTMLALLGPSGCGKTTCLRMIAGLVRPSSGEIFVDGKRITGVPVHRRNIGMLFQNYALFPHMTVAENVAFGLQARRLPRAETEARVAGALQLVRLDGYADRMPARLSGGQQQRVALARCLVVEPSLLLLDEPLGALDKSLRESMQVELRALQQRLGITTIMVTHDQDEALTLADRIAIMRGGQLEQLGSPAEVYQAPVSRFVAGFIGVSNFFQGRVERRDGPGAYVTTDAGPGLTIVDCPTNGNDVTVAVRPEAVIVEPVGATTANAPNSVLGTVEQVVYRGFISHTYVRLDSGEILIAFQSNRPGSEGGAPPGPGTRVLARWTAASNRVVRDEAPG